MTISLRRLIKNFIWLVKYSFEFLKSFFNKQGGAANLIVTVDVETSKDFMNWQNTAAALDHARVARQSITDMINLTEKYNIPITWLCTGQTLLEDNKEPLGYFGDLINRLLTSPVKHEIGSHTFSHPHCGQITEQQFEDDMKKLADIFRAKNIKMRSHAYPWNEVERLGSLEKFGIKAVRLKQGRFPSKIREPEVGKINFIYQSLEGMPLSFWLIKFGLNIAIKSGACFVWLLHPENFFDLEDKIIINQALEYASLKRAKEQLKIITMQEI